MDLLTDPRLDLISQAGALLKSVVESAETLCEEGFHLTMGSVAVVTSHCIQKFILVYR